MDSTGRALERPGRAESTGFALMTTEQPWVPLPGARGARGGHRLGISPMQPPWCCSRAWAPPGTVVRVDGVPLPADRGLSTTVPSPRRPLEPWVPLFGMLRGGPAIPSSGTPSGVTPRPPEEGAHHVEPSTRVRSGLEQPSSCALGSRGFAPRTLDWVPARRGWGPAFGARGGSSAYFPNSPLEHAPIDPGGLLGGGRVERPRHAKARRPGVPGGRVTGLRPRAGRQPRRDASVVAVRG